MWKRSHHSCTLWKSTVVTWDSKCQIWTSVSTRNKGSWNVQETTGVQHNYWCEVHFVCKCHNNYFLKYFMWHWYRLVNCSPCGFFWRTVENSSRRIDMFRFLHFIICYSFAILFSSHLFGEWEVGFAHLRGRRRDHEVALDRGTAVAVGEAWFTLSSLVRRSTKIQKNYRVTNLVVPNLMLTPKQMLRFSTCASN